MKLLFGLLALVLSGCTTVKPVTLADGTQGHAISCGGAAQTMGDCMAKAGEICGASGFQVVDQSGSSAPFMLSQGTFQATPAFASGGFMATQGAIIRRSLFVKCGKAP